MSERGKSGIYAITCTTSGKVYVGQAASIGDRWLTHRSHLNCGRHANRHLQSAWVKHGAAAFMFTVLEYVEAEAGALVRAEQAWVGKLAPAFNIAPVSGSTVGLKHPPRSAEFRQRMSEMKRGFKHSPATIERLRVLAVAQDYHPSAEHIEKMRRINTGRKQTAEQIEKHRQMMLGRPQSASQVANRAASLTGQKRTPEQCARIAQAKKGHGLGSKQSPEHVEKKAAALRGRKRPAHVVAALVEGRRKWLERKRAEGVF